MADGSSLGSTIFGGLVVKLGKNYVDAIVTLTALAVVSVYVLEDQKQRWVLAHPVLDGAIGGAIIIPITGVIALAVIDSRLDALARREKESAGWQR